MENVATTLLDYILNLLNDPKAMEAFVADREGALTAAGLGGCGDEVDAALTTAGAGSLYYASKVHYDWSDDRDVTFVQKYSDNDGIDDSFNDNIIGSFNTTNTTINDNDFTNNGVFVGGDNEGNIDNDVDFTNVEGDVIEGDVIGGDDNSIETNGGDGAGSGAIVDASGGDGGAGGAGGDSETNQTGLVNVGDVPIGIGVGVLGTGTGTASANDGGGGGAGGAGGNGGTVTFENSDETTTTMPPTTPEEKVDTDTDVDPDSV